MGKELPFLTFSVRRSVREKEAAETLISFYFVFRLPQKVQIARDVYEELLTQAEIQGNINKVNSRYHIIVIVLIERVLQNKTCALLFL